MEPDFSGYATRAGVKCTDGRTIMRDAFKHQDKVQVPLVWQHGHNDPTNVLGHAVLENREDGVYAYAYFNGTEKAEHAKAAVQHKDLNMLSIWAGNLLERSKKVLHGTIKEVSLVLAGANSGATIDNVTIRHSEDGLNDDYFELEDEAIIVSGVELEIDDLTHADDEEDDDGDETVMDVYNSMTEKQKNVLHYMVGEALATAEEDSEEEGEEDAEHSDLEGKDGNDVAITHHNVFENGEDQMSGTTLSHEDVEGIFAAAQRGGSLGMAVKEYALSHGIDNIGLLFPEATSLTNTPEFYARRTEWVNSVLGGARKTPFSRVRTMFADITMEEARAKGYITGNMKKEEFFSVSRRETTPTTIYKKQQLDRDDLIDITDFDVVAWLRAEMRVMLDEELARAVLVGDGRDPASEDKISEQNIRPIAKDHELYTTNIFVNLDDANSSIQEVIDAVVSARYLYRGSGMPNFYTTESVVAKFMLLKDTVGRRIYKNLAEVADELRVKEIVPVEILEEYEDLVGIIVNMADYNIGADKGGEVNMFDDFDIDYNKHKYLLETRVSGALTKLKAAMVVRRVAGAATLVTPVRPTFDPSNGELVVTDTAGVLYQNYTNPDSPSTITNSGGPYTVASGAKYVVRATPTAGNHFAVNSEVIWTFTANDYA